jgi:hypothetical protein
VPAPASVAPTILFSSDLDAGPWTFESSNSSRRSFDIPRKKNEDEGEDEDEDEDDHACHERSD